MNKTAITTLNVTLSVNGANAPNQKTEWLNGYKRLTADLETYID